MLPLHLNIPAKKSAQETAKLLSCAVTYRGFFGHSFSFLFAEFSLRHSLARVLFQKCLLCVDTAQTKNAWMRTPNTQTWQNYSTLFDHQLCDAIGAISVYLSLAYIQVLIKYKIVCTEAS